MNKIVSVLELSLQHRNEDLAQLKHVLSVRNSEINTLKGVVFSTQRRCFILQHKIEAEKKASEEVEEDNKDLKMVLESLKANNCMHPSTKEAPNSKETLANSYRFLQNKYQERLTDLETVEQEFGKFKEDHSQCTRLKKLSKAKKRPPFFRMT